MYITLWRRILIWLSLLNTVSFLVLTDVNECEPDGISDAYKYLSHNCHDDSNCTNSKGSFYCTCLVGYSGNGVLCTGKLKNDCKPLGRKCKYPCYLRIITISLQSLFGFFSYLLLMSLFVSFSKVMPVSLLSRYWWMWHKYRQLSRGCQLHEHKGIILLHMSYGILRRWSDLWR